MCRGGRNSSTDDRILSAALGVVPQRGDVLPHWSSPGNPPPPCNLHNRPHPLCVCIRHYINLIPFGLKNCRSLGCITVFDLAQALRQAEGEMNAKSETEGWTVLGGRG